MPSSSHNETRNQIVRAALRALGNSQPSATQQSEASDTLNALLKRWDADGNWAWTISAEPTILNLAPGVESYAPGELGPPNELAPNIFELVRVERWRGGKVDYQIEILSQEMWIQSRLRKEVGEPTQCHLQVNPDMLQQRLFFAPISNGPHEIRYYFKRRIFDFDAPGDTPDLPQEWIQTLKFGLAAELGPEYGLPLDRQSYLDQRAAFLLQKMQSKNEKKADKVTAKGRYF